MAEEEPIGPKPQPQLPDPPQLPAAGTLPPAAVGAGTLPPARQPTRYRPADDVRWVCQCGWKNRIANSVCGGVNGKLGCKTPRPAAVRRHIPPPPPPPPAQALPALMQAGATVEECGQFASLNGLDAETLAELLALPPTQRRAVLSRGGITSGDAKTTVLSRIREAKFGDAEALLAQLPQPDPAQLQMLRDLTLAQSAVGAAGLYSAAGGFPAAMMPTPAIPGLTMQHLGLTPFAVPSQVQDPAVAFCVRNGVNEKASSALMQLHPAHRHMVVSAGDLAGHRSASKALLKRIASVTGTERRSRRRSRSSESSDRRHRRRRRRDRTPSSSRSSGWRKHRRRERS
eukprot:TRINITY_DN17018_c0_g1_i1.p1 TRINITY_DN17018_c0_g1~~TRINITY_DN17018_c0_g1_i1.p1  ORF type:complete len:367 (+),score=130.97 TRINITY_DN17018_c0_g1_i1:73-1101(+)